MPKKILIILVLVSAVIVGYGPRSISRKPLALPSLDNNAVYAQAPAYPETSDETNLLARLINGEAESEPYEGQVAVAAVILNRVEHPSFPNTLSGVIYEPDAFESVSNGLIWQRSPSYSAYRAAEEALMGWDPTFGAIFFWNPSKPVNPWVWTRQVILTIGNHVFAL